MSPPRPPPRPASRDGPRRGKRRHSSEASAFPALGKNRLRSLKQRGAACRTLREKKRRRSLRSPEARRNIQRGEIFLEQRGNFTARDFSEPCPARSVHRMFLRAAEEPPRRRRASAGLSRFRAQKRRREARRLFISTLQSETRRLLPPFPRPRRDEWAP